jgi:hypothetical protein
MTLANFYVLFICRYEKTVCEGRKESAMCIAHGLHRFVRYGHDNDKAIVCSLVMCQHFKKAAR